MFGDLMCSNDFSEDGCSLLWKDVFLAQQHRENAVGISAHDTSVERTVFNEEEEGSLRYSMESRDFIDDVFTFDHFENCTEDYRFSQANQNSEDTFLPTFGVNIDSDEKFCDSVEGQSMLALPSLGSSSPDAESFPDEINIADCDVFEDFNTELNCDSNSAPLSSVNFEGKEGADLPSEFVCIAKDVFSYSNESQNDVNGKNAPIKHNYFVKVVKNCSNELTMEGSNPFDNGSYGSHTVIEAAIEADLRDMRKTGDEESDTGLNRNAIQARINRAKKKAYIARLEEEVQKLSKEKVEMKRKIDTFEEKETNLIAEVQYLKSVLSNDSMLANLISNIGNANSVELTSPSISHHKRKLDLAARTSETSKRWKPSASSEGICLHVCQDRLSLELCHHCANSSRASIATDNNRCKH